MNYLGDFLDGKSVYGWWNANAVAGESITRATNGTISVYKNNSDTQTTTGVTDTEDFDSLTGVNRFVIDTSADASFYAPGNDFAVVLSAATIDGKTINACLGQFSLRNRSNATIIDRNTAQASTVTSTILASASNFTNNDALNGSILSFIAGTGKGQSTNVTDFTNASDTTVHPTVAAAATTTTVYEIIPFGMNAATVDGSGNVYLASSQTFNMTGNITGNLSGSVGSVTGAVGSVTGNVGGNVTGSVGSVTGAVGSVTGNVGGNVSGSVGSVTGNVGGNVVGSVASVTANVTVGSLTTTAIASIHTTAMTEVYGTDGGTVGLAHGVYEILALLGDFAISGTTLTTKKRDGSTTAGTYTLNSSTSPTSITRAS